MIPYGHQSINQDDIDAVIEVLKSDWLTQGPKVAEFEQRLAAYCGVRFAVVCANGTAALHAAYFAAGLKPGDEVITSPITFASTANAAVWQGAQPVFVDVDPVTGNINANLIEAVITPHTKVIAPIDYTGRPADLEKINAIAEKHRLLIIEDACQALGAEYHGKKIGSHSHAVVFSFHPVKSITTGEGGAIVTNDEELYKKMKMFVTHGITKEDFVNDPHGAWYYEMQELGLNYRLTDIQCALGINQLKKVDGFVAKRRAIAERFTGELSGIKSLRLPLLDTAEAASAWHLYVVHVIGKHEQERAEIFAKLRKAGIGVQVHHIPVYMHPYYRNHGFKDFALPETEKFYNNCLSLPIYPDLTEQDQDQVVGELKRLLV
jgi:perosamine synthetase